MPKLIEQVRSARTSEGDEVDRHWFRFWPFGWAAVYVDHWGILTIASDWGSWSHAWGGSPKTWGAPTFNDFLRGMSSPHYLADKLSYGRTRTVPDPDATEKAMKEHVDGLIMTPDEADELREQIDNFCQGLEDSIDVAFLCIQDCDELKEEFDCLHEWVVTKTAPKVVWLIEEFLPVFLAHLQGTLQTITADEWEERYGRKATSQNQAATEGP